MAIVASGQITLVDLNDSKQLISYIGASRAKTVIYNPDTETYIPNYATSNQVLTPQLFIAGTNQDIASQAKSIKWFYQTNSTGNVVEITGGEPEYDIGTGAVKTLTIKQNVLSSAVTMKYICEIVYADQDTGFDIVTKSDIELVRVTNGQKGADGVSGEDAIIATVWTPEGNMIKNHEGTLKATVVLYKGSTEVAPSAFKWYIQDPTATTADGGDEDGGDGWRLITDNWNAGVTGYNSDTITIPASAIAGIESFKCVVTYQGNKYQDVCTVIDVSDPIVVTIIGANTFKNGQGQSTYTAKLYRDGSEIDVSGTEYIYKWYLYKEDGILDNNFGVKTGKSITVSAEDFYVRANLVCEVSE